MSVQIKRVYEEALPSDGYRVLVDRLWPRGVSKEKADLDEWLKDVAPSPDLRIWFGHREDRFKEFSSRYQLELDHNPALNELNTIVKSHKTVTLLYGARDPVNNHANVLLNYLNREPV